MGDFFNGWRRKLGLLTLVAACLFMSGWLRSLRTWDDVLVVMGDVRFEIESKSGFIEIMLHRITGDRPLTVRHFQKSSWRTIALSPAPSLRRNQIFENLWPSESFWRYQKKMAFCGLTIAGGDGEFFGQICLNRLNKMHAREFREKLKVQNRIQTRLLSFPYIYAVLMFTILSAHLIFIKPGTFTRFRRSGFFRDGKRILGIVTLLAACASIGFWIEGACDPNAVFFLEEYVESFRDLLLTNDEYSWKLVAVRSTASDVTTEAVWETHHWTVVIPLTVIALWFLLSKPLKSTEKKLVDPISPEEHDGSEITANHPAL